MTLEEIAAELRRPDLPVLDAAQLVVEAVAAVGVSETPESSARGGRPGAAARAARALGLGERRVQRLLKVAALAPEAKEAARTAGLSLRGLLHGASKPDGRAQLEAIRRKAVDAGRDPGPPPPMLLEFDVERALALLPQMIGSLDLTRLRRRLSAQAHEWAPWLFRHATRSSDCSMLRDVRLGGVDHIVWLRGECAGWASDARPGVPVDPLTLLARATKRDGDRLYRLAGQLGRVDPAFAKDPMPPPLEIF